MTMTTGLTTKYAKHQIITKSQIELVLAKNEILFIKSFLPYHLPTFFQ